MTSSQTTVVEFSVRPVLAARKVSSTACGVLTNEIGLTGMGAFREWPTDYRAHARAGHERNERSWRAVCHAAAVTTVPAEPAAAHPCEGRLRPALALRCATRAPARARPIPGPP